MNDPIGGNEVEQLFTVQEGLQELKTKLDAVPKIPFEDLDRRTWAAIQELNSSVAAMLGVFLETLPTTAKLVTNDAVREHMNAVISSDD